jgi:hypothetical protein
MMHAFHEGLPGYDPAQILHDSCNECERRSNLPGHVIADLDLTGFRAAWERAIRWNKVGLVNLSHAEMPALSALWAVQLQFERLDMPIGMLPTTLTDALGEVQKRRIAAVHAAVDMEHAAIAERYEHAESVLTELLAELIR